METAWLRGALGLSEGETPFPWQDRLLARFMDGTVERWLDIPTGLGKTGVMAIWLVARARGADIPRRLVYVVDRRAVVDQATEAAMGLRAFADSDPAFREALGLGGSRSLPISTLRGQHVDNRVWLEDPASPAIIVGTVDMIGSRLLFEGYGVSRKMRPYHAGLLGADTLVVLDEAHLVPPFEELLKAVARGRATFGPRPEAGPDVVPPLKLLALSATGRGQASESFGLDAADLSHPVVGRRLDAPKLLTQVPLAHDARLKDALVEEAWRLAGDGKLPVRLIVYCDSREDAKATAELIEKRAKREKRVVAHPELFVGARRVFERENAASRLRDLGFLAGTAMPRTGSVFVCATSAGEVGVDLDADHAVMDVVAWERMVQRLGRVNRRGEGRARVVVLAEKEPGKKVLAVLEKAPDERTATEADAVALHERRMAVRELLGRLPVRNGARDASPGALRELKREADADPELARLLEEATTPAPLRPALSRALVDAWSMTSLEEHTGRPEVQPWLRGWVDEPPQTAVLWRTHLPVRPRGKAATKSEVEAFFEAAPPHASELLETETYRVIKWLADRAKALGTTPGDEDAAGQAADTESEEAGDEDRQDEAMEEVGGTEEVEATSEGSAPPDVDGSERRWPGWNDIVAIVLGPAGDLRETLRLVDLAPATSTGRKELQRRLAGRTLVVDARFGGLSHGLLDGGARAAVGTADGGGEWIAPPDSGPVVRFRVRVARAEESVPREPGWRERARFATDLDNEGEPVGWLVVDKWRHDGATEEDRSEGKLQLLDEHVGWVEKRARDLARRLQLRSGYEETLAAAARLHDRGKESARWQAAFNAPGDGVYAKTRGPLKAALLDGYRHEFGSLLRAAGDAGLGDLPEDLCDLALHLVAAHHGFARPLVGTRSCDDAPPSALEGRAREATLRFARLQKRWGPWGLAWWEALLRAADQQASRDNDDGDSLGGGGSSDG